MPLPSLCPTLTQRPPSHKHPPSPFTSLSPSLPSGHPSISISQCDSRPSAQPYQAVTHRLASPNATSVCRRNLNKAVTHRLTSPNPTLVSRRNPTKRTPID